MSLMLNVIEYVHNPCQKFFFMYINDSGKGHFVPTPCITLLKLTERKKPNFLGSLRHCAPLWPIAKLNFFYA
jgi:hypothetical protein